MPQSLKLFKYDKPDAMYKKIRLLRIKQDVSVYPTISATMTTFPPTVIMDKPIGVLIHCLVLNDKLLGGLSWQTWREMSVQEIIDRLNEASTRFMSS